MYKQLRNETNSKETTPNKDDTMEYWKAIWEKPAGYNKTAAWIDEVTKQCETVPQQRKIIVTITDIRNKLAGMSNWKAPGPDQLQTFWMKKLTSTHERLAIYLNAILEDPKDIPSWLVEGTTLLIQKDPNKEASPDNFRPITCLPTMWKILSGIIANKIMNHLAENNVLCHEQKGARPQCRGTKDQLAIDRTITHDNKRRHTNLAMAWIDYRKAYDSVPHAWILKCMDIYKVNRKVCELITQSMKQWKTTIRFGRETFGDLQIRRGIFQGDSLSPILFCMALNPLSEVLHKTGKEYQLGSGKKINHLLYMDDLKLYTKKEEDLTTLVNTVKIYSDDISMQFGFEKCARIIIQRGKIKATNGMQIDGAHIRDVGDEGYKYLGIIQQHVNLDNTVKTNAKRKYRKRLKQVLKSKLFAKNKVQAINQYAVPVITYTGGAVKWNKEELNKLNTMTRKVMTMYGALHPRADVDRLYVPRSLGGRGLKDLAETIESENRSLKQYINEKDNDPLLEIVREGGLYTKENTTHEQWKENTAKKRLENWKEKPMHGQYARQVQDVTSKTTRFSWLKNVNLKIETEALITAAQDQALNTKSHQARIMKISNDPMCRMCKNNEETVSHLLSGCSKLAGTDYTTRHNEVGKILHRNICTQYEIQTSEQYWRHQPQSVTENEKVKLLWNFEIQTDRRIQARRPDIVLIDKTKKKATIIDIAVPDDRNINNKEKEKITKYQDLCLEIKRMWNVKAEVVPIVIGALGAYSPKLEEYLAKIPGNHRKPQLVKAALLGSAHILRRILDLPESW